MPNAFLIQQMEWREGLDEAATTADLNAIKIILSESRTDILQRCGQLLDAQKDYAAAVDQVRALMFIERFDHDVEKRFEQLEQ